MLRGIFWGIGIRDGCFRRSVGIQINLGGYKGLNCAMILLCVQFSVSVSYFIPGGLRELV